MKVLINKPKECLASPQVLVQKIESPPHATTAKSGSGLRNLLSYLLWKEIFDRVAALLAIAILFPILAIIALGIRVDSPGNPIYCREQIGKDGRLFTAYKFRTMRINNDDSEYQAYLRKYIQENAPYKIGQNGRPVFKLVDDSRVTRFGVILRKTNMDELPQLLNVLKGDMSFVGPRPDIPVAVELYQNWHMERLSVKPGITGAWQVNGRKGISFEDMVSIDIDYIKRRTLLLDARILLLTVGTVLKMDGS